MVFKIEIPTPNENRSVTISLGTAAIFVGANGTGKTRLAVHIEKDIGVRAHRISAHKSLKLDPQVAKIPHESALGSLRFGTNQKGFQNPQSRTNVRWKEKPSTHLLSDYDFLVQVLFAEQANTSLDAYHAVKSGAKESEQQLQFTKFDQLKDIWQRLLPHRLLHITGDDISVSSTTESAKYTASEMSDGERAIFYMIGQTLVAVEDQLLIVDEPEQHVHPSIMSKLWDELEAVRTDCAFVYITHDLAFAANRNAQKFVIRDYMPTPTWDVEDVPDDTDFSEELTTLILGSRRPILFVEGTENSLDLPIYRACYPGWTVIPCSSCTDVIHSVITMRNNDALTRVTCTGIVDGDDYAKEDKERLEKLGIHVLSVSEVENLLLLPSVTASIFANEGYDCAELAEKQAALESEVFATLDEPKKIEEVVVEYCKRRIDRSLKKLNISTGKTLSELQDSYALATAEIDIVAIAKQRTRQIKTAVEEKNLTELLEYYDYKGLIAIAARHLKNQRLNDFKSWVTRSMRNETCLPLKMSLLAELPRITLS